MEPHLRKQLEGLLDGYEWLVPNWCARVAFRVGHDTSSTAFCQTRYQYRDCGIQVNPPFWALGGTDKERIIVHELVHNFFNPLYLFADDMMDATDTDAPHHKVSRKTLEDINDACTEDMTNAVVEFTRKMYARN